MPAPARTAKLDTGPEPIGWQSRFDRVIMHWPGLNAPAKLAWHALVTRLGHTGAGEIAWAELQDLTGAGQTSARRWLEQLAYAGLLAWEPGPSGWFQIQLNDPNQVAADPDRRKRTHPRSITTSRTPAGSADHSPIFASLARAHPDAQPDAQPDAHPDAQPKTASTLAPIAPPRAEPSPSAHHSAAEPAAPKGGPENGGNPHGSMEPIERKRSISPITHRKIRSMDPMESKPRAAAADEPAPMDQAILEAIEDRCDPARAREAKADLVAHILRVVNDPDMDISIAGRAAEAVIKHNLEESELDHILETVKRKAADGTIRSSPGAYFHSRIRKLCRQTGIPWPMPKPK